MKNFSKNQQNYIPLEPYYEKENILNVNLVDSTARKIAEILAKDGLNKNQLRKYYGEIKNLEKIFKLKKNWKEIEPFVKMVKSKVYYGKGRKMRVDKLSEFLEKYINQIKNEKDFIAFCKLFEAVVGYFYAFAKK